LAPTWGDQSILNTIGSKLCKAILDQGHTLTVRPHYETVKRTPGVLQGLQANFSDHPKFNLILSMSENESLFRSQLLITDWSGISIEYSLGLGKPVIFIDLPPRVRNLKWQELGIEPFESWIRNKVGKIILPDDIDGISEKINEVISQTDQIMTEIKSIREQWVYNLGQTRNVGPKEIIKLLK
jgi:YidC/Oxa1 family membrane protein insertase